mmetsp:Transcript_102248/g.294358  ORF Transcript_102248/g.294358 Transcript_102248/m.294358 type:complete len:218 (-) Transcript_102248:1024-1677(-)
MVLAAVHSRELDRDRRPTQAAPDHRAEAALAEEDRRRDDLEVLFAQEPVLLDADPDDRLQGVPQRLRDLAAPPDAEPLDVVEDLFRGRRRWGDARRGELCVLWGRRAGLGRHHLRVHLRPVLDLADADDELRPEALHVDDDELDAEAGEGQLERGGCRLELPGFGRLARCGREALPLALSHEVGQAAAQHRLAEKGVQLRALVDDAQVLAQVRDDIA